MPTGYTDALEKMEYDTKRWIKESVSRGMGMCILLRDYGRLTAEEIREHLKNNPSDYDTKELNKYNAELTRVGLFTESEWQKEFLQKRNEAQKDYDKRKIEFDEKEFNHKKSMKEIEILIKAAKTQPDHILNTLKFAQEQLQTAYNFDYGSGPYRDKILDMDLVGFQEQTLKDLNWRIKYHTEQISEDKNRNSNCYNAYCDLVRFVDGECLV